jgi:arylsulfatase A-like enzyme
VRKASAPRIALALVAFALALPAAAQGARPNIVLILTDDQRWDTVSAMPQVMSRLVGHGVTFSNGLVVNPLCCPSRASILTGRYSHSTRVYSNNPPLGGFASFRDNSTIATWLHTGGYRTAFVGKYLNCYVFNPYVPPGWNRWFAFANLGYYSYGLNVDGAIDAYRPRSTYSTDRLASEAVRFIRTTRPPFFLYFAPYAPHAPAVPAARHEGAFPSLPPWRPPSWNEADVSDKPAWVQAWPINTSRGIDNFRRRQLQTLLAVDQAVARILNALAGTGRLHNTIVVFTSDNGFFWREHRLIGKSAAYEESIRVPFVVRYDRLVAQARDDPRLVANIDLAPTFAAAAGVSAHHAEGRSLLPLLGSAPTGWRNRLLIEHLQARSQGGIPTYCALRNERYTFVVYRNGERELYDLVQDPNELQNVARDPLWASTVGTLRPPLSRLCNPPPPGLSRRLLCTREGTAAAEIIAGTLGYDVLCAGGGNDSIDPRRGRDWVFAGSGNDRVVTRDGNRDHVFCGVGSDLVLADALDIVASSCERIRRG